MKLARLATFFFLSLVIFFSGTQSISANVIFDRSPADETYNGAILNTPQFVSFSCSLNLNCGVSGQTVYNIGVWMKKVGNPIDIRLQVANTWTDPNGGTLIFSNSISSSSISDTEYTLKWFHFPLGVVIGSQYSYNQFFQFQFTEANGTYNPTDYYRVLQNDTNDYSAPQQWCKTGWGCSSSTFFWKMDDGTDDQSLPPEPIGDPNNLSARISSTGDVSRISINCTNTHNYTLSLVHRDGDVVSYSYGVVQRKYCQNGVISFDGFNINNLLITHVDLLWWNWVHTPLEYIIKDTTGLYYSNCDINACTLINEVGDFNGYDYSVYLASSTYWTTVGRGPIFDTSDHTIWFNIGIPTVPPPPPLPTCCSNVLFIPGLEASRLYKQKTVLGLPVEDQLWEPNSDTDVLALYLNTDGTSSNTNIYTRDIIGTTNVLPIISTQDIYKSLIAKLDDLTSTDKITSWKAYAYDWRQGIDDLIQNGTKYDEGQVISIIGTLQSLVNSSKNGKVTIIAHSNGGILAKALIKKLQDMKFLGQSDLIDHIDNLVMVASPQLGTPDAMSAILHGYKQSIPYKLMSETQARKLAQNMPSAYGLLPSRKYFDQAGITLTGFFASTSSQIYKTTYGSDINNYQEEHDFILGQEGRVQPAESDLISPAKGNSLLLAQAESLHDSIDNMTFPTSIKVIDIAGWGKETISGITYTDSDIQPIYTIRGDKTVIIPSALYGQGTKYWLDLSNSKLQHKDILEDTQLLDFIDNIIEKKPLVFSIITDTEPFQIGDRLHLSVHSPVSIGTYDNQGNFTGKICDDVTSNCVIKEDIPGSTYFEFGEGKYINLSAGNFQKAILQGTGIGTFTYESERVFPNETAITSSFIDIPVTTQTQVEITLNQTTGTPELKLDVTGDGVFDFNLSPSSTFDLVTYLQIMKATIDSLDLPQAKKNAFDKRVDNIIKQIQKNKINKATTTIDRFKKALAKVISKPDPKKPPKIKKLSKTDAQLLLDMLNRLLDNIS